MRNNNLKYLPNNNLHYCGYCFTIVKNKTSTATGWPYRGRVCASPTPRPTRTRWPSANPKAKPPTFPFLTQSDAKAIPCREQEASTPQQPAIGTFTMQIWRRKSVATKLYFVIAWLLPQLRCRHQHQKNNNSKHETNVLKPIQNTPEALETLPNVLTSLQHNTNLIEDPNKTKYHQNYESHLISSLMNYSTFKQLSQTTSSQLEITPNFAHRSQII